MLELERGFTSYHQPCDPCHTNINWLTFLWRFSLNWFMKDWKQSLHSACDVLDPLEILLEWLPAAGLGISMPSQLSTTNVMDQGRFCLNFFSQDWRLLSHTYSLHLTTWSRRKLLQKFWFLLVLRIDVKTPYWPITCNINISPGQKVVYLSLILEALPLQILVQIDKGLQW